MEPRHRKLTDDEREDAEYIDEHNDDDEIMLTLPSAAQNGIIIKFCAAEAKFGLVELG